MPRPRMLLTLLLLVPAALVVVGGGGRMMHILSAGASGSGTTERVSLGSGVSQGIGGSGDPSISADGRYVAFTSYANNLVAGDTNLYQDAFVRDRITGATERVSVAVAGGPANFYVYFPAISADGRYVAFHSSGSGLVVGDTNGNWDVFLHDRVTGGTERVSVDSAGVQGNSQSQGTSISADGRYTAFWSYASNLVVGDTNNLVDLFVHDRVTGATERVSVDSSGAQANGNSLNTSISADGRYVAFYSGATNLVLGDTNASNDVFVHDRVTHATERVSVDSTGLQGAGNSEGPAISADGRFVSFYSAATNLVAGDTNGGFDVFAHDRVTGATERLSVDSAGAQGNNNSYGTSISGDGRYVAFVSNASNLVLAPCDTNSTYDVFLHDRSNGTTERVSVDSAGVQGNNLSHGTSINADGRYVAFVSWATNLVPGDTNNAPDVFVRDREGAGGACVGGSPTATATATPPPAPTPVPDPVVVLVHGWDGNAESDSCGMEELRDFIEPALDSHPFAARCYVYRSREGVASGAAGLFLFIEKIKKSTKVQKVDIVAHSMGGLVSRYYIEELAGGNRSSVRSLTMLGTPNKGTRLATAACIWSKRPFFGVLDRGACDMVPGGGFLNALNQPPIANSGVGYQVLTGDIGASPLLRFPNDCVVEVESARGPNFQTTVYPVLHMDGDLAKPGCSFGNGEMNDPAIRLRIKQILLESNGLPTGGGGAPAQNAASITETPTPVPNGASPSTIGAQSGVVVQGETIDIPVVMPASQPTGTFVFRSPADPSALLTFVLLRPGGTPVATTDADVTHETGAGFGGLVETHYTIANPAAGTWTMRVTGTTVPETGWPYDVQALVPGGISVTAGAGAGHYDIGQPFDLSAEVAINDVPYAGATVSATLTKPDNTATTVALVDAGGGAYSGSFADTIACGLYQVTITAEGSDNGTPFSRQDRTIAIAGVPGNVILDPCDADSDDDWLTDETEIDVYGTNPANADTDGDGFLDSVEIYILATDPVNADTDGDLISDGAVGIGVISAGPDNCALVANADQLNTDRLPITTPGVVPIDTTIAYDDALGDACDSDDDNDGIGDDAEPAGCNGSGPLAALLFDTDGDRTGDAAECALGSDPYSATSKPASPMPGDQDSDGLPSALETTIGSDPLVVDTDGDGINDGIEYRGYNTSPSALDSDNDACNDDTEITDITGSRKTDVVDIFLVAGSFGLTTRPNFDITKDGSINVVDLFLIAANVTQGFCPPQ